MENEYKILENLPEKNLENKDTTSLKWKRELIDFFKDKKLDTCLEIGTCYGITTKVLSTLFNKVDIIEFNPNRMKRAREFCKGIDNINFHVKDAYKDSTYADLDFFYDVVVIDCMHLYPNVIQDINRALSLMDPNKGIYLVFDDFGHPESTGVYEAISEAISMGLKKEKYIGEDEGFTVVRTNDTEFTLIRPEGIILSYGK